ncbi:hypothetical protein ACET3Z_012024 [Daucus carota]
MSQTNHFLNTFITFFEGWLQRLENYLREINQQHDQEETSSFLVMDRGYKPSQVLRLVSKTVLDISEDKKEEMEEFREHIKGEERRLMSALAAIHDSVAMPSEDGYFVAAQLKSPMEALYQEANDLREMTVCYVLEKLESAHQKLRFFASAIELHLRVRAVGNQRDAERQASRA